jgi:hypothetical protein
LQVVDVSSIGKPHSAAKALYFTVKDLDGMFARAKALGGERSFYVEDPWRNPLCFVEAGTDIRIVAIRASAASEAGERSAPAQRRASE